MNEQVSILDNNSNNPTFSINGNTYFAVSLLKDKLVEEKEMVYFIKSVERIIRSSPEYRNLTNYIKSELNINYCSFLNNITVENGSIELHHTPYNLHQIVETVILKNEAENKAFNSYTIALEVMSLHYMNYIGLCPLSKSIHELVHSDDRFHIHRDLVLGEVDAFYNMYNEYMTDELRYVYKSWKKYCDENPADSLTTLELFDQDKRKDQVESMKSLNKEYTIDYYKKLPKKEEDVKVIDLPQMEF